MSTFPPEFVDLSNKKWERTFVGISRVNSALTRINAVTEAEFPLKKTRIAELRFLRGHYYFDLKIQYKRLPYIDETLTQDSALAVSNVALTNDELWSKIVEDFRFAADNLPVDQPELGRANQINAKAYLAKVLLYQAYEQNDQHAVVNINKDKLEEVIKLVDEVIASGNYDLFDDFGKNFLYKYENGIESVFAIQRSHNDGTVDGKGSYGTALNTPDSPEFGCCGFHRTYSEFG
ncbi:MAG: RagB/SusD family nutrient uptake outer membrane protein [Segetibacter sp.]